MNPASNLFLVGPMGAGKSTVGRRIAHALGLRFVDLDRVIEEEAGSSIALIFEMQGEAAFRVRESETLARLVAQDGIVLATGGGSVLAEGNRRLLRERGYVLWLEAPVELQLERLARDRTRPLLRAPDRARRLHDLAQVRDPIYRELADLTIAADRAGPGATARRALIALERCWQRSERSPETSDER
ncbi:MAG: shikimate kinase [Xanthomonadales bacterium]|nr:Shikimate kinase 1 [Xanthomonadales bacterium]MCC6593418.1 shikimate kinase [Xanthomonadales bacterium]MCE7930572.1 shikimate kinase [Xanthomonadales bacterium PRO6]